MLNLAWYTYGALAYRRPQPLRCAFMSLWFKRFLLFKKYSRLYAMIETRGASKYAFSYASIGGKVTMTLAQEEPYIRLRVYNTGAPIDQKDLPHLFERLGAASAWDLLLPDPLQRLTGEPFGRKISRKACVSSYSSKYKLISIQRKRQTPGSLPFAGVHVCEKGIRKDA